MMITAGKFKAQCLRIMDEVRKHHREVIITKYGRPVAKLVCVPGQNKAPLFGLMKDSVILKEDIVSPLTEQWNAQGAR